MTCYGLSVGVIVRHADQVLMIQRAEGPQRGTWACVAGHWEADELPARTAVREVAEEVGVHASTEQLGDPVLIERCLDDECSRGTPRHDWWVYETQVADHNFRADPDETMAARWVPLGELAAMALEPVWRHMLERIGHI